MSDETPVTALFNSQPVDAAPQADSERPPTADVPSELTPEEAQAVEAVFAQEQENRLVSGLLGVWTSSLVLRDLAVETFSKPEDEDEEEARRKKKKDEDSDR
jgi:hypothetical protein